MLTPGFMNSVYSENLDETDVMCINNCVIICEFTK